MKYSTLNQEELSALANLHATNEEQFIAQTKDVVTSTIEQYKLLYNEFPKDFLGILNGILLKRPIPQEKVFKMIQDIANVQYAIAIKEQSLQPSSVPIEAEPQKKVINLKSKTIKVMKNSKNTALKATDTVLSVGFGTVHFILQSAADITLATEGAVRKHTSDLTSKEIQAIRVLKTYQAQNKVISTAKMSSSQMAIAKAKMMEKLKELARTESSTTVTKAVPDLTSTVKATA